MLLELNVKDIALIRKASVSFNEGLNIMTGETGAGKSIIIDSAMLALGGRIKGEMIRKGAEAAYVELVFDVEESVKNKLKALDITPDENGLLVITRKIMPGKSISKINDETVTGARLREITSLLIDIYGQNEFHTLNDEQNHLTILDQFLIKDIRDIKNKVREAYIDYKDALDYYESFNLDESKRSREQSLCEYEINEIEEAKLSEGEEDELSAKYKKLNNAKNIIEYVDRAHDELDSCNVSYAIDDIRNALRFDEGLGPIYEELMDVEAVLNGALKDISDYVSSLDIDTSGLSVIEERLDLIRSLELKYGKTVEDINNYKEEKLNRLEELNNYEENKKRAWNSLNEKLSTLQKLCESLSDMRKKGAVKFIANISAQMMDLGFEKARLDMHFTDKALSENGSDNACIYVALNQGENLQPLQDVASGGELSRIMLAIKTVLAASDEMPALIFDEIDTGISGRTAQKVALKLCSIAANHQIICITHLPQIASMADTHFVIEKNEDNGRNITEIKKLDEEGSIDELSRLLGGEKITDAVYQNAKEMKALADEEKTRRK